MCPTKFMQQQVSNPVSVLVVAKFTAPVSLPVSILVSDDWVCSK
jgi:hypothetical protein